MASDDLIAAQLHLLQQRLPAHLFDELADGLDEIYQAQLRHTPDQVSAARRAVTAFGDADTITAAACAAAPWRRAASTLLMMGPVLGGVWAAFLIGQHAWTWPLPLPARGFTGIALLGVVALLLVAHLEHRSYRRGQWTTHAASAILVALDAAACCTALRYGAPSDPVLIVALTASLLRAAAVVSFTTRQLVRSR